MLINSESVSLVYPRQKTPPPPNNILDHCQRNCFFLCRFDSTVSVCLIKRWAKLAIEERQSVQCESKIRMLSNDMISLHIDFKHWYCQSVTSWFTDIYSKCSYFVTDEMSLMKLIRSLAFGSTEIYKTKSAMHFDLQERCGVKEKDLSVLISSVASSLRLSPDWRSRHIVSILHRCRLLETINWQITGTAFFSACRSILSPA